MRMLAGWRRAQGALLLCLSALGVAHAEPFSFVALGDTAYNGEADYPVYSALINRINQERPAFSIHIGDVWGATSCLDEDHRQILGWFARYEHPLIYTPGDNEWTDCIDPEVIAADERIDEGKARPGDEQLLADFKQLSSRATRPGKWALDSLARIRRTYFSTPRSLGQTTIPLVRQAATSRRHPQMVENARWAKDSVVFATVHVVGSMNSLSVASPEAAAEAVARNQANVEWIQQTFAEAAKTDAKAIVLAMHASFFDKMPAPGQGTGHAVRGGRSGPYGLIALAIQELSAQFGKPVLLIHGDDHEFTIDRPFLTPDEAKQQFKGGNVMRLQVYGAPEIRAVRIGVDTATPWVFSFSPLFMQ
ncbi:hypothetical protein AACH06_14300 [Ideonella sp. DXS29W]|uniref:Calcineurin-like phosphoesterase domain-containing protein n=1 Tax=Ideonella lacteola TaxID=2984193 RepID=A0ABU9BSW5_9BURK